MKNTLIKTVNEDIGFAKALNNKHTIFNSFLKIIDNKIDMDKNVNDYYINNLQFRDKVDWEKGKPAKIIALGCSNTYGIGVPQEYTWPSIVESITKKTVANLGTLGASAEKILESFLLYLDTVGNPEYVLACFPEYLRYSHILDGIFYSIPSNYGNRTEAFQAISNIRSSDHYTGEIHIRDKIVKLPADPRYIIPAQESLRQYINSIYIIEKICKFLNIKFYWGTWSIETQNMFLDNFFLNEDFCLNIENHVEKIKSGISSGENFEKPFYSILVKCQLTHSISEENFKKYQNGMWKIGSDEQHLGIHWQYHTAESFIEKIKGIQ
jgi:hypothetical protein